MNWKAAGKFLLGYAALMGYVGLVVAAANFIEDAAGVGWALATMFAAILTPATVLIGVMAKEDTED